MKYYEIEIFFHDYRIADTERRVIQYVQSAKAASNQSELEDKSAGKHAQYAKVLYLIGRWPRRKQFLSDWLVQEKKHPK